MTPYIFLFSIVVFLILFHNAGVIAATIEIQVNTSCECGKSSNNIGTRIVNGMETIPHAYPWVVPILNKGRIHCGGTIINDRYILTAGHCVRWTNHKHLTVALGVHDLLDKEGHSVAEIKRVILHENFTSGPIRDVNDLSILELKKPIKLSENVQVVCLPTKDENYSHLDVKVVGWGRIATRQPTSHVLRETTMKVISFTECQRAPFANQLANSMICAYKDDTDACQGDSGGPLLFQREDERYVLIGVVSWGLGCAVKGMPGVYVKIIDYINWIKYNTRDGVFCANPPEPTVHKYY